MPAVPGMAGLERRLFSLRKMQFAPWKSHLPDGSDPALESQEGIFVVVFFLAEQRQLSATEQGLFQYLSLKRTFPFLFSSTVWEAGEEFTQTLSGAVD